MPVYKLRVHEGRTIWPERRDVAGARLLRDITPEEVWFATWQGVAQPPSGYTYRREFWHGADRRFDLEDAGRRNRVWIRVISWDTGIKDKDTSDYSGYCVFEVLPDYRAYLVYAAQRKMQFPDLAATIPDVSREWNRDKKLQGVVIEDKVSGTSALQTLRAAGGPEAAQFYAGFVPTVSKVERARQAAIWSKNGSVLLPLPGPDWLPDFEMQLFAFPQGRHDDMADAYAQGVLYLENILAEGFRGRVSAGLELTR